MPKNFRNKASGRVTQVHKPNRMCDTAVLTSPSVEHCHCIYKTWFSYMKMTMDSLIFLPICKFKYTLQH